MNIITYTENHNNFRKRLRRFCEEEVIPYADKWEEDHIVPKDVWKKMGQAGFLCPTISEEYGGIGGDFIYSLIVTEELSKTWQAGLAAPLHSDVVVPYIDSFASEKLKKRYLPGCVSGDIVTAVAMTEANAGSDVSAMETTAEEDGDEIVINGSKTFISNGVNCDLLVLAARDPLVENKHHAVSLYLVEAGTKGFEKGSQFEKMGWRSQDTTELFFNDCRIPKDNILGEKGTGFIMLMQKLQQERLVCAMGAIAQGEGILNETKEFCIKTIENGKPLSKSQAVKFSLVEMETELTIGRTFIEKLIADHMEKKDIIKETCMAKFWTTELAKNIANKCLELYGDFGTLEKNRVVRGMRDVRITSIFAGTNEIMKGVVGKFTGL